MRKSYRLLWQMQAIGSAIPYGWKEIDIAAVGTADLFRKCNHQDGAGHTIQPDDELPDMLRKKE